MSRAPLAIPPRERLVEQLVGVLAEAVVTGRFAPGEQLPSERDLARDLGVNRTSLRQALARLEQMGLAETRHGVGTIALDPFTAGDTSILPLLAGCLGTDFVAEVLEAREVFAGPVGRLAGARIDEVELAALDAALVRLDAAADAAGRQSAEGEYFDVLVGAARNRALLVVWHAMNRIYRASPEPFRTAFEDRAFLRRSLGDLTRALRRHDADAAARLLTRYASESGRRMLAGLGEAPLNRA